jgi:hypothetical protein
MLPVKRTSVSHFGWIGTQTGPSSQRGAAGPRKSRVFRAAPAFGDRCRHTMHPQTAQHSNGHSNRLTHPHTGGGLSWTVDAVGVCYGEPSVSTRATGVTDHLGLG